eukprot:1151501-Pelagomonas_calceolata.AAC.3
MAFKVCSNDNAAMALSKAQLIAAHTLCASSRGEVLLLTHIHILRRYGWTSKGFNTPACFVHI